MIKTIYHLEALTGGSDSTYLDYADGNSLSDGDRAYVIASDVFYAYRLNATSGAAESSPNIIAPDTNPGDKRWILVTTYSLTAVTTSVTAADNDSDTSIATTAFAKSQDAVLHRELDQGVALTAAASGSSGITVADNDNIDFGTGNFTLVWKGSLPDWTPVASANFVMKYASSLGYGLMLVGAGDDVGKLYCFLNDTVVTSTIANSFVNGTEHELQTTISVGAVNTTVTFYADGVIFGAAVVVANETTVSTANALQILGYGDERTAGTVHHVITYNRALTAAEVLDLYRNGVAESDKWGSQTEATSGTLVVGKRYRINNWITNDDFTNVGGANVDGTEFVATGTTPTTWTNSSTVVEIGATIALTPEMIGNSLQWPDASSNNLHALLPVAGATITRPKREFLIKGTNTWAGTHEPQSLNSATDDSRAILSAGCYITDIIGVIAGGTIEDIIIGDGSDTDHWVAITTGLAAGTVAFTVANRISDGTNYEMVIDPDANFTGSISWTVRGIIL